jgi:iron complex outermembrane recepter protein
MLLAVAVLASFAPSLTAQGTGSIEGRVVAAEARSTPLGDVAVAVRGTTRGALTDAEGRYRITGLAPGSYTVIAQVIGRARDSVSVTIAEGTPAMADLSLAQKATVIAPTVVSASREAQRRTESSATIDVLDGGELRRTRAAHPSELLNRMPGVHVTQTSGEGHMASIRQPITTKPVYLYLEDGVPTRATGFFNHNALYEVNIPQSGGIEVLKGPGTALYGSDAIGGVINVLTRPAPATPTIEMSAEGGSYGYGRLLVSGGAMGSRNGVRADLNLTRTDGWRDGSAYDRQSGAVRWDLVAPNGWTARTVVTGSSIDQHDLLALDSVRWSARNPINLSPIAFRKVQAARWSTALEREHGAALWSVTPYARYDVLELMPNWQLSFDPQVWDTRNNSLGVLAKYRRDLAPLRTRVVVGADADWSPGSFTADQVVAQRAGTDRIYQSYTTGVRQYDYDVTYRAVSPYAQLELSPLPRLRIDAGARYDISGYDYTNHLGVDQAASQRHKRPADTAVTYHHLSPKVGVTYDLTRAVNLYASYRHGFRAPSQSQLFQQNSALNTIGLEPVKVDSYEGGVRGQVGARVLYQLAAYDMVLRDDILTFRTPQNTQEAVNAGKSRYSGIEGALGIALRPDLRVDASASASRQRYVRYVPQAARPATGATPAMPAIDYSGNRVETAPKNLANVLVSYSPSVLRGGRVGVEWSHTGGYAMDPANTHEYPGYELLTLHFNTTLTHGTELFARVTNLANTNYAELVTFDNASNVLQYNPGNPRSVYAGLRYTWQK